MFHYTETGTNIAGTNVALSNVPNTVVSCQIFGLGLTSNIRDMALFVFINYREPTTRNELSKPSSRHFSPKSGWSFDLASRQVGAGLQSN